MTAPISLGINIKSVGKAFLKPDRLITAKERAELRVLRTHGSMTRTIMKRSMRPGRKLRFAEYPRQLQALLTGRDGSGRQWQGAGRSQTTGRFVERVRDIKPAQMLSAPHGQNRSPLYYTKLLRDHIYYVVDYQKMSVVTGAADLPASKPDDTPELLNSGGTRTQPTGGEWRLVSDRGTGRRKARLVNRQRGRVRYRGYSYAERSHAEALDANMPDLYRDSVR